MRLLYTVYTVYKVYTVTSHTSTSTENENLEVAGKEKQKAFPPKKRNHDGQGCIDPELGMHMMNVAQTAVAVNSPASLRGAFVPLCLWPQFRTPGKEPGLGSGWWSWLVADLGSATWSPRFSALSNVTLSDPSSHTARTRSSAPERG